MCGQDTKRSVVLGAVLCGILLTQSACSLPSSESLPSFNAPSVSQAKAQVRKSRLVPKLDARALINSSVLTVGIKTRTTTAPFVMSSSTSSTDFSGIDVDYAYALADELGLQVKFVEVSDVGKSLGKDCDIVLNAKTGEATTAKVIGNYAEAAAALFSKGKSAPVQVSDLTGKRLALQKGSLSELVLRKTSLSMLELSCANLNEAFEKLDQGEVDYVLCEAYAGAYLSKFMDGVSCVGTLDIPLATGIATDVKNTDLQAAILAASSALQSNGVYDLIRARWIGSTFAISSTSQIKGVSTSPTQTENTQTTTTSETADTKPKASDAPATPGSNAVHL